jgi:hypothetical protein
MLIGRHLTECASREGRTAGSRGFQSGSSRYTHKSQRKHSKSAAQQHPTCPNEWRQPVRHARALTQQQARRSRTARQMAKVWRPKRVNNGTAQVSMAPGARLHKPCQHAPNSGQRNMWFALYTAPSLSQAQQPGLPLRLTPQLHPLCRAGALSLRLTVSGTAQPDTHTYIHKPVHWVALCWAGPDILKSAGCKSQCSTGCAQLVEIQDTPR